MRHPCRVLDQRLDAAQRLAKDEQLGQAAHLHRRLFTGTQRERHHAPEVAHLPRGELMAGVLGQPWEVHLAHCGVVDEERSDLSGIRAVPVHPHAQCLDAAQHQERVERSRHGTIAFWWNASCSPSSASRRMSAPPTTSLCPPRYFVVECTTTSAPSASGCCRYGEANVLSTTSSAPASWAMSASAAMSAMPSSGLVGVSHHTTRVVGRSAARTASRSESATGV